MNKKISIIGVGKLGLCLALNLERIGYDIIGVDISQDYIDSLSNKTFESSEPFVTDYLKESKNIFFTTDLKKSLESDIIFLVVSTPSTSDYKYDHSSIEKVVDGLKQFGVQDNRKELVINCTTFPGYCDDLQSRIGEYNYKVSYNPEFIAQGSIIMDQINADNVLIGEYDKTSGDIIEKIYRKLCYNKISVNRMTPNEAELTKLSVNCFLTTKISYANMIGDICNRYGANPSTVLSAIGTDSRIGSKYLNYGFGFGGPCFPRDNRALSKCAEEVGVDAVISKATDEMNKLHLKYQIEDFFTSNPDKDIPVEIDYVTYKKESTSIEESQQLQYAIELSNLGYKVKMKDSRPEVINQIKSILK